MQGSTNKCWKVEIVAGIPRLLQNVWALLKICHPIPSVTSFRDALYLENYRSEIYLSSAFLMSFVVLFDNPPFLAAFVGLNF